MIRPASPEDLPAVSELERELFGPEAWSAALLEPVLSGTAGSCLVAEVDGRVVGYVVTAEAGDALDLQRIGVAPAHRRRGAASALLEAALASMPRVLLEVGAGNRGAIAFYQAEGFTEIARRRRYYRDGSDAVVMQRSGRGTIGA